MQFSAQARALEIFVTNREEITSYIFCFGPIQRLAISFTLRQSSLCSHWT
jgi:hypothetical protein